MTEILIIAGAVLLAVAAVLAAVPIVALMWIVLQIGRL